MSPFLLLCSFLLVYLACIKRRKLSNYPSGPPRLPFIGNLHQLGTRPYLVLTKWAKQYGSIFSIKLGLDDAIVVSDPKLIKELFNDNVSSGRIQNQVFLAISEGKYGIVNTEREHWEEQRRFVLRKLRDFGFAKTSMEGMILEEAQSVLKYFHKRKGVPVVCHRVFNSAVVNSLWRIVSGECSGHGDACENKSEICEKSDLLMEAIKGAVETGLMFAPFLRYIIPNRSGWNKLMEATKGLNQFARDTVHRHRKTFDSSSPSDLVDHYLAEMEKTKDAKSSFYKETGERNLTATLVDLFEAGNETTATTMLWLVLYLSHHPDVQQRLIKEIESVIGYSRAPSLTDRLQMPYTEAVLLETLRKSSLLPMGVLHRMLSDHVFHGYVFPKHCTVIPNLYAYHHDPDVWGDPENFRPERFLSEDSSKVIRRDSIMPFSVGRRVCLGESVAKDTIFLFTTSIFQKFQISPDSEHKVADFEPQIGFLNIPKPFKVILKDTCV